MKKNIRNTVSLGVFVTLGIFLLIAGIYFIGQKQRLFSDVFRVSGVFNTVNGLQVGNNIRFSGINVGTVENIEIISDTSVRVDMMIDKDVQKFIKKDAKAIIGSEGLMGNKTINIAPGTMNFPMIEDQAVMGTSEPVDFDAILAQLKTTSENAALITTDLSTITSTVSSGKGTIGRLLMDSTLADNLGKTLVNLRQGTQGFEENMNAAQNSFLLRGAFKKQQKEKDKEKEKTNNKKDEKQGEPNEEEKKKKGWFNRKGK
ncbi:MAG: MlaD family protein [Bacteroidota bacterium]|nr:MlaD family protein [Bacteroidota bacterium]